MSGYSRVTMMVGVWAFFLLHVLGHTGENLDRLDKRDDSYKVFERKRNAHACIMSITFCVLLPLGAISIYLPIDRIPGLRNTYLVRKVPAIHAPIQILATVMMIGGMAMGIEIAQDLRYLSDPVQHHPVIGLVVVCIILVFQPLLGGLQHRYFKKHGQRSIFGTMHRWIGRGAILLGIINSGLGFQLAQNDRIIPTSSYVRNFVLAGVLCLIWFALVLVDTFMPRRGPASPKAEGPGMVEKQDTGMMM